MLHPTSLLPALALAATAVAQVGWTQRHPTTRPPARSGHATTYDAPRGVTVLFGGYGGTWPFGDTWEWNGVDWTQRVTAAPPARYGHAFAFDILRSRAVLFGGTTSVGFGDLDDTWEFDGSNWTQMQPANRPSLRRFARMEYDLARGRIVLFGGGYNGVATPTFNDTWEWNGVDWTLRSPATSPPRRWDHGMVYDFARNRIVMFGGSSGAFPQGMNDTWAWDGTNWTQLPVPGLTGSTAFGLAHDAAGDVVVRFGGTFSGADTWVFDHVAWRRDSRTPTPPARAWCSLVHDLVRNQTILFGGHLNGSFLDDTWEYEPGTIARWTTYGSGCQGTSGVPMLRLVGVSLPIVGATFQLELLGIPGSVAAISIGFSDTQWNGGALPFDLGALGMTGCTLHASPDFVYFVPVVAGHAILVELLPNAPNLIGTRFYDQGFVFDPGVNPLGATVSNAGAGVIGPF